MAQFDTISRTGSTSAVVDAGLKAHMSKVFGTMTVGLLMTALVSWAVGQSDGLFSLLFSFETGKMTILGWVAMFLPLGMVFAFGPLLNRISAAGAQLYFYAYAAAVGLSLAWIFRVYTDGSITQAFLATAAGFAGLSLWGYTTKRDLSGMGSFLIMGVIGLIVASLLNLWFQSGPMTMAISALGVLIFAGLTAYDTQKIKGDYLMHAEMGDSEFLGKAAIMGALNLYLDFINIFMYLLRLFGNRE